MHALKYSDKTDCKVTVIHKLFTETDRSEEDEGLLHDYAAEVNTAESRSPVHTVTVENTLVHTPAAENTPINTLAPVSAMVCSHPI